jgi:phenylacetate-CoA ligase
MSLTKSLKQQLEEKFSCPVIDWYSLNETGPIGYTCSENNGYHVIPDDLFIEILNPDGTPAQRGEVVVTGGRNPFLPLLRYRTGDWGELDFTPCVCGDNSPRIVNLEGREPVIFYTGNRHVVNPVDISRMLGDYPIVQHQLVQRNDYSLELNVRPLPGAKIDLPCLRRKFGELFGSDLQLEIEVGLDEGQYYPGEKLIAYCSEV